MEPQGVACRWTPALVEGGWLPVSNYFLDHYRELPAPLTTAEAMTVLHVLRHKWGADHPWPSAGRLAARMGVSATSARNHLRALVRKGYLRKVARAGRSNGLDVTPLFEAMEAHKRRAGGGTV